MRKGVCVTLKGMGLQSKPTHLLPLTKCHFMTVVSILIGAVFLTLAVSVQSYKFIRQTRPDGKRPGYGYKGRWPGVLARKAPYV